MSGKYKENVSNANHPQRVITVLAIIILILSAVASLTGIFSNTEYHYPDVVSAYGEKIKLYNIGLYARDSVSMASQAIAQDFVTMVVGIPLMILALFLVNVKKSAKGWFLLTGTLGYFLYTYVSYSFLMIYNQFYLLYLVLMILSFYAFLIAMGFLYKQDIGKIFSDRYPIKGLSIYLIIVGVALLFMWLGRIVPTLSGDIAPYELEHYATLVIQSLDLGFIVPAALMTVCMLHKHEKWGYILSAVLVMKMLTMAVAVSAMGINEKLHGVDMGMAELCMFPIVSVINILFLIRMLATMNDVKVGNRS